MSRYFFWRLVQIVPTILGIATLMFVLFHLAPGDAADALAGEAGAATPEYMAQLRERFGLDQPLPVQYVKFLGNILSFDLGHSHRHNMPVLTLVIQRMPVTIILMLASMGVAVSLGIVFGMFAARYVNTPVDWVISITSVLFYSVPVFWLALMMVIIFSVQLGWLPTSNFESVGMGYTGMQRVVDIARHMIMPIASLSAFYLAAYARLMRASMLEVYGQDFVRTAEAKGLSQSAIGWRHVFRNALTPVVTMAGLQLGSLLGGAVVVEQIFALPGMGRLAFDAVFQRDYNLLLSILLLSSILVIAVNLLVDLLYTLIDPRVELR